MTKQEFQKLTENHVLLLDGATGSNLMKAGMPRGVCTESWVLEHKDVIQSLQKAYIEAGSHIIYAPTFGGNRINLTMHGLEDQIEQINHTLAGYTKEITPEGVYVAGDITTTGKMMAPAGDMTYEKAFETYQEQIGYLRDAGVDLIVAETMINIEETRVVLGKDCKGVTKEEAKQYIFGYTIINDISARNLQTRHKQWYLGKSLDGFTPMGPCIVTADEIGDEQSLEISCTVNGELRQSSNTKYMIQTVCGAISELSQGMTLQAGTIIATGTPAGVGMGMQPPQFLQTGDVVECRIAKIGILTNTID